MSKGITAFLFEEIDAKVEPFGKYEEAKARITIDVKISSSDKKKKKMIKDLEEKLGMQDECEGPLMLTHCLGEDRESDDDDAKEEEESVEKNGNALEFFSPPPKKAKKVIIIEPKVRKYMKKFISKPMSFPLVKLRTRSTTTESVKTPLRKRVLKNTILSEGSSVTSSSKKKTSPTKG